MSVVARDITPRATLPASTPAGLTMARMILGVGVEEWATLLHVDRRTVQRWESGYSRIPPGVAATVEGLLRWVDSLVVEQATLISERPYLAVVYRDDEELADIDPGWLDTHMVDGVPMPASMHRMIIARAAARVGVAIHYPED